MKGREEEEAEMELREGGWGWGMEGMEGGGGWGWVAFPRQDAAMERTPAARLWLLPLLLTASC